MEIIITVATAVAAIIAIRVAARPPDAQHSYGHHKGEHLSAVVVGPLIIVAALAILREAYAGMVDRRLPEHARRLRRVWIEPVAGGHPDAIVLAALALGDCTLGGVVIGMLVRMVVVIVDGSNPVCRPISVS